MELLEEKYLKYRKYLIILLITIFVLFICFNIYKVNNIKVDASNSNILLEENRENIEAEEMVEFVTVDIKGMVLNPGVYTLEYGSRIIDVIKKAGGLLEDGNTDHINLSRKLTDEMLIKIFSNEEIDKMLNGEEKITYLENECICDAISECPIEVTDQLIIENTDHEEVKGGKISINKAPLEELLNLPGIGEAKAKDIIEYRNNQPFTAIEDIMNVKGIGTVLFDKIKDYIDI